MQYCDGTEMRAQRTLVRRRDGVPWKTFRSGILFSRLFEATLD